MEELEAVVNGIIFKNDDNGYTVAAFTDTDGGEFSAVGCMPLLNQGERVLLKGAWKEHPRYGPQFEVATYSTIAPATLTALENYLSSGTIKGIGDTTAHNIVQAFGMDTLWVLENQPERLTEVVGIGQTRAATIIESFTAQREMREVMLSLQEYEITPTQAVKLYRMYGPLCVMRIRENPYCIVDDIDNIGFKRADVIARSMGIEQDSPFRLQAGIKYTLSLARREGHTCLPEQLLVGTASDLLQAETRPVENELEALISAGQLLRKTIDNDERIFLPYLYYMELYCARRLAELANTELRDISASLGSDIDMLQTQHGITLSPDQRTAVENAMRSCCFVITGGPGTGKTTILRFIIGLLSLRSQCFELAAPTGRAAKRMSEATGEEARTIHRLLEYGFGEDGFKRNEDNPLSTDAIIIDETSMVDVTLMNALLKAVSPKTRLILVGDADQLPSVGPGNVLSDIMTSGIVPFARLELVYRQAQESMIVTNAHRINSGLAPFLDLPDSDFRFEPINSAAEVLNRIIGLSSGKSKLTASFDPFRDVQVLAPLKKQVLGVNNLNSKLQEALNPPAKIKNQRQYGDTIFREGDKVMQTKNDYDVQWTRKGAAGTELGEGVFNGDLGVIRRIDSEAQTLSILFDDDRYAEYDFSQLDELDLAYCISIHKSQGSEFPVVILPAMYGRMSFTNRSLLYTAVTRAKALVIVLGQRDSVLFMVNNSQQRKRYSGMKQMLVACEGSPDVDN